MAGAQQFGNALQVAGMINTTIGAFYSTQSQRYVARSQRLNLEFQGSIAEINARAAEQEAHDINRAGQFEQAKLTLRFGQARAANRVRRASAGLQAGVGSAGEVSASIEAIKEIDSLTIGLNAVRAVNAASSRAVNFRNEALLSRVSAKNVHDTSKSLSPGLAAFQSLLGAGGQVAGNFAQQDRRRL